jgi:hypothetical protein
LSSSPWGSPPARRQRHSNLCMNARDAMPDGGRVTRRGVRYNRQASNTLSTRLSTATAGVIGRSDDLNPRPVSGQTASDRECIWSKCRVQHHATWPALRSESLSGARGLGADCCRPSAVPQIAMKGALRQRSAGVARGGCDLLCAVAGSAKHCRRKPPDFWLSSTSPRDTAAAMKRQGRKWERG